MIVPFRVILFVSALCYGAITTAEDNDMKLDHQSASIFTGSLLDCGNTCEIRVLDGECKVDVNCLVRSLFSRRAAEASNSVAKEVNGEGNKVSHKVDKVPATEERCQGKCLFMDKNEKCRLDLICVLDRDVEGTLRFLVDLEVDPETAVALALSAKSAEEGSCEGFKKKFGPVCKPCERAASGGRCIKEENCEVGPDGIPRYTVYAEGGLKPNLPGERVVVAPLNPCPGKCEVRDPVTEKCIVDLDCVDSA